MPKIPVDNCCGCTACVNICPKAAIRMIPDAEGFVYPDVNDALCVSCGMCEKVCPILHHPPLQEEYVLGAVTQSNDQEVLDQSTSGGFLDSLYRYVLENGGYAAGVCYDEQFLPVHVITDRYQKAKEFRNSKYAQSDLGTVFGEIKELLVLDKQVLFVGTPCQVAGLMQFLGKKYTNLITADLVCRSIPSPMLWKEYLQWQEQRYQSRISHVSCRKKTYGYHSGALEISFENGKHYRGSNRVDYYMKSFHHDICSRPSCYQCQFKTKHRCSDFTVFDSWKPQEVTTELLQDNDRGYSNVIVHTEKGKLLLSQMEGITVYPADPEKMFQFTGGMESQSIVYPDERSTFYRDLDQLGFLKTVQKHVSVTWLDRAIEAAKPIRYTLRKFR